MRAKKVADILALSFLTVMVLLTLFAEDFYRQTLPKVTAVQVEKKDFPFSITMEDGTEVTAVTSKKAIPEHALFGDEVWVLMQADDEGKEYVIERVSVRTGERADGYVEIVEGLSQRQLLYLGSDRPITPGQRVMLANEEGTGENAAARAVLTAVVAGVTILLFVVCWLFRKKKYGWLRAGLLAVWFVAAGFLIRQFIVFPAAWF